MKRLLPEEVLFSLPALSMRKIRQKKRRNKTKDRVLHNADSSFFFFLSNVAVPSLRKSHVRRTVNINRFMFRVKPKQNDVWLLTKVHFSVFMKTTSWSKLTAEEFRKEVSRGKGYRSAEKTSFVFFFPFLKARLDGAWLLYWFSDHDCASDWLEPVVLELKMNNSDAC